MLALPSVQRARNLIRPTQDAAFDLRRCLGRVVELSEPGCHGATTLLSGFMAEAQSRGENTAWVTSGSVFYPPDLAARGLDLNAITVTRVPAQALCAAADILVRSGAFSLVVLCGARADEAELGRLARLAEKNAAAVIFLTRKPASASSLGSAVSLRAAVFPGEQLDWRVLRDKHSGPLTRGTGEFHGPLGLY